ncbi:MAG: broad specificity phosphatase PhoE [Flavobacteriaceae bacterium]|jgi:broad specificity phosphatase PhoE
MTYIIRHMRSLTFVGDTESVENNYRRLKERGTNKLDQVKNWLQENNHMEFDSRYTSPYLRSRTLAHYISPKETWEETPLLSERNKGDFTLILPEERKMKFPREDKSMQENLFYAKPPNGESFFDLYCRTILFLQNIKGERVLASTSGGNIYIMRMILEGWSVEKFNTIMTTRDTKDRIYNGHVLEYRGNLNGKFSEMRSVCTTDTRLTSNEWRVVD